MKTGKILLLAKFLRVFFNLQEMNKNSIMTLHNLIYNFIMLFWWALKKKKWNKRLFLSFIFDLIAFKTIKRYF